MPEGVAAYPRWKGALSTGPAFPAIAAEEWRRAWKSMWFQLAFFLVLGWTVLSLGSLYTLRQSRGEFALTAQSFTDFIGLLPWLSLAIAAIIAGPSLLEDHRRGTLELYLSRAVTRLDYLFGKVLAAFVAAFGAMYVPMFLYWLMSFFMFEKQPADWNLIPLGGLAYGLLWAGVVTGLGMGLSSVSRSSRAAALMLFFGFATADAVIKTLLETITKSPQVAILSPMAALQQQQAWAFQVAAPYGFPWWWGLLVLVALTALGWGLLAWKHPRLAGA